MGGGYGGVIMEEAYQIFDYLPRRYRNKANQEYLQFLWDSFETNYQNGKYTFAFIAFHMLYMSVIYSILWKIKHWKVQEFEHALIGFNKEECKKIADSEDLFIFHIISERRIFNFLKLLSFTESEIGQFRKTVNYRNEAAHSNGVISFSSQNALETEIYELLGHLETIQASCNEMVEDALIAFLQDHWDIETNQYYNYQDEINEVFIPDNSLSQADLNLISDFDIQSLAEEPHFAKMGELLTEIHNIYAINELEEVGD